ncbi:MAG: hypothetical protein JO199_10695 [Candidatus Eremiobacteraeota bacterium]|nr:hypothetical protein [Candidatus Eremiobacteraeota bacterium]
MELQRALSDLEEVRERLAHLQRFEGYSGTAAAMSGLAALVAGAVQLRVAPLPHTPAQLQTYLLIWMSCLAVGLLLNYGTAAAWLLKHRGPGAQSQFRSAARSIAPSVVLAGALTLALVDHVAYVLLPGMWFALYAMGLFASRNVIPASALVVTCWFAALALLFLISPLTANALSWWVMPLGFGLGQIAIGALIWQGRHDE